MLLVRSQALNPMSGTTVRVVGFVPQQWDAESWVSARDEQFLVGCYIGKVGTVVAVHQDALAFVVRFSVTCRVPIAEMRFHRAEVEES